MSAHVNESVSQEALSRYIDRFLFAEGWRVSNVETTDGGYEVTLTKESGSGEGQSVSHSAPSAGEATFKACGRARKLELGL